MNERLGYGVAVLIVGILSFYFYGDNISLQPAFIHAWTQSDRWALALGYLHNGFDLFTPRTFNLSTEDGITGVDLPIHEYVIALLMKIFDTESPVIFRTYTLCYSFLGLWFLHHLVKALSGSFLKGLLVVLFIFTCPIIAYYQNGFIPSSTSLSSAFIAYYFYFRHYDEKNKGPFYIAIGMMTLAALSRSPFHIFLFALFIQELFLAFRSKKIEVYKWMTFALAYFVLFGWMMRKSYLNNFYGSQFLTQLMPAESFSDLYSIISEVFENWVFQFFTIGHYLFFLLTVLIAFFQWFIKKKPIQYKHLILHSGIILTGAIFYFILMSKQFVVHEYYFIDSFYLGFSLLLVVLVSQSFQVLRLKSIQLWVSIILMVFSIICCKSVLDDKYSYNIGDRGEMTRLNFIGSDQYLDSLDIAQNAHILVIDAYSTNMPLIQMKRKGFTVVNTISRVIKKNLELDFDYIVMQDKFMVSDVFSVYPELISRLNLIGSNGKISIFQYEKNGTEGILSDLIRRPKLYNLVQHECNSVHDSIWQNRLKPQYKNVDSLSCSFLIDSSIFYGPTVTVPIGFDRIVMSLDLRGESPLQQLRVVASSENKNYPFYWENPIIYKNCGEWKSYQCMFVIPENVSKFSQLKSFIWNKGNEKVTIRNLSIEHWNVGKF